jgi:hypothetical protein
VAAWPESGGIGHVNEPCGINGPGYVEPAVNG